MKFSIKTLLLATAILASVIVHSSADCNQQKDLEEVHGFEQKVHCGCSDEDDQLFCIQYDGARQRDNWCSPKGAACDSTEDCCGTWKCKNGACRMTAASTAKDTSKMGHIDGVDRNNDDEGGHSRSGGNGGGHRRKLRGA